MKITDEEAEEIARVSFGGDDTARAFDELQAWLEGAPDRSCERLARDEGRWCVMLGVLDDRGLSETFTAGRDITLRGAIRNALMIAKFAGHP